MVKNIYKSSKLFPVPLYLKVPSFGIDISDESLKFMKLKLTRKGMQIEACGKKKIPKGIIELGKIRDPLRFEHILTELKKEQKIKDVRVSILENQTYLFKLKLEKEGLVNIKESIEFLLEEHIPIPASETIFDYEIIEETETDITVQVVAIQTEIINDYLKVFENCAINVHSFELEAEAIARAIIKKGDMRTYMIIDIGERRTGIFIISKGVITFTSTIDFSSEVFNSMLEEHLNISKEEAEKIKINYGLQRNIENKDIFPILLNGASLLRDEILKHFFYWHSHEDEDGLKNPTIDKILFCGGTSSMIGLADYFTTSMKIETEVANFWINIKDIQKEVPKIEFKDTLSYITALGLALGNFEYD